MHTARSRISDILLRVGTDLAVDRAALVRRLSALPGGEPDRDSALGAMVLAGWVESTLLWLSWRLRPRRMPV